MKKTFMVLLLILWFGGSAYLVYGMDDSEPNIVLDRITTSKGEWLLIDGEWCKVYSEPNKPYLYKDPLPAYDSNDPTTWGCISIGGPTDWVCSKHGRLKRFGGYYLIQIDETTYCGQCTWDVVKMYLDQHITGIKE